MQASSVRSGRRFSNWNADRNSSMLGDETNSRREGGRGSLSHYAPIIRCCQKPSMADIITRGKTFIALGNLVAERHARSTSGHLGAQHDCKDQGAARLCSC